MLLISFSVACSCLEDHSRSLLHPPDERPIPTSSHFPNLDINSRRSIPEFSAKVHYFQDLLELNALLYFL